MERLGNKLFSPVDASSLVFFRIALGLILLWDCIHYFQDGLIARYWLEPLYNFSYTGFGWVKALPAPLLYLAFALIGVAALCLSLGLFYRFASIYLFIALSYFFLLEETRYLNHNYFLILLCFLLIVMPLARVFSLDAQRLKLRETSLPYWVLLVLRFQIALPYFFGGVAKLQADWLRGQPMGIWLGVRSDFPLIGSFFKQTWFVLSASYAGLLIDLLAVPLLLYKRTRAPMLACLIGFHYLNAHWFTIGVFPWLMIAASTLFLEPNWPKELLNTLKRSSGWLKLLYATSATLSGFLAIYMHGSLNPIVFLLGGCAASILIYSFSPRAKKTLIKTEKRKAPALKQTKQKRLIQGFIIVWMTLHSLLPLRHFIIPGDSIWTEEGHRFAWHMMLRLKQGSVSYIVDDPKSGERREIDPADYLASWQVLRLEDSPHLIHEFARYLGKTLSDNNELSVRARTLVSLNGRKKQPLIDSSINLAKTPESWWHANWILPLREPLP